MGAQRLTVHTIYVMSGERPQSSGKKLMDRHPQPNCSPFLLKLPRPFQEGRTHSCTATTNKTIVFLVCRPGGRRCAPAFPWMCLRPHRSSVLPHLLSFLLPLHLSFITAAPTSAGSGVDAHKQGRIAPPPPRLHPYFAHGKHEQ